MRGNRIVIFALLSLLPGMVSAFEQHCEYSIQAELDPDHRILTGHAEITYTNNARETLYELYFELYPNAFRKGTLWWKDTNAEGGLQSVYPKGFSESGLAVSHVFTDGTRLKTEPHAATHGYYLRVELPSGIAPGGRVTLTMDFTYTIPEILERGGYYEGNFHLIRWYPLAAQYDDRGWHLSEHTNRGEFSGTFGTYTVELTIPERFVIAASGVRTQSSVSPEGLKTETYVLENAHNFAFCADTRYKTRTENENGIPVTVYYFFENSNVRTALESARKALRYFSSHYGEYPYRDLDIVVATTGSGAMEYPGLMILDSMYLDKPGFLFNRLLVETTVMHETGHMWWYAAVASNETEEPWLDEGLTSFSELVYLEELYGKFDNLIDYPSWLSWLPNSSRRSLAEEEVLEMYLRGWQVPVETHSADKDSASYGLTAYNIPALLIDMIRERTGTETFAVFLREYYSRFQFHHPTGDDFFALLEEITGESWSAFREMHFIHAATDPALFKGLGGTRRSGIRYSLIPGIPDSDEILISILPVPYLWPRATDSGQTIDLGAGLLFFGKHRILTGFTAYAIPRYIWTDPDRFAVDYYFSTPLYLFRKPVRSQSLSVSGTEERVAVSLDTGISGSYSGMGSPVFEIGLDYSFEGSIHTGGTRTSFGFTTGPAEYTVSLDSVWFPAGSQTGRLLITTPVFFSMNLSVAIASGWTDSTDTSRLFSSPKSIGSDGRYPVFQSANLELLIPITGRLHSYFIREFLIWNGISLVVGTDGFFPGPAGQAIAGSFPELFRSAVYAELPVSFSLFGLPIGFSAGPAVVYRPGAATGAFDFGFSVSGLFQGRSLAKMTMYSGDFK